MNKVFGHKKKINLGEIINIPADEIDDGVYKCRVVYTDNIEKVEFIKYAARQVKSLKIVEDNKIDYRYKYLNRERLNYLYGLRAGCDDIIILKNNRLTDTSFSNIVLWDGKNWVTPKEPLLKGTRREYLLQEKMILEKVISIDELNNYFKISLVNSMLDLNECVVDIDSVLG
jgi:4-amino-4-deoxychorismate lyase